MSNKHHDLLGVPKHANQHRLSRLTMEAHTDELRIMASEVESYTDELIAALEAAAKQNAQDVQIKARLCRESNNLHDRLREAEKRIAELEAKLETADKLQDSAFRHGLQHGFSLGQTDNQAGFEECLSAYGTGKGE